MELIYTYVEKYNGVKFDIGFNFSPNNNIKYSKSKKCISIEKTKNISIDNLYGDNINNVNIIVGENGAGKTSLLEVLSTPRKDYPLNTKYFSVFKYDDENYFIEGTNLSILPIEKSTNLFIDNDDFYITCQYNLQLKVFENVKYANQSDFLDLVSFIYSPNNKEPKNYHTETDETLRAKRYLIAKRGGNFERYEYISKHFKNITEFNKKREDYLKLELPKYSNTYKSILEWLNLETSSMLSKIDEYQDSVYGFRNNTSKKYNNREQFIINYLSTLAKSLLQSNVIKKIADYGPNPFKDNIQNKIFNFVGDSTIINQKNYLINLITFMDSYVVELENTSIEHGLLDKNLREGKESSYYQSSLNSILKVFEEIPNKYFEEKKILFPFSNKENELKMVENYFLEEKKVVFETKILEVVFPEFSTGETQLIDVISGIESSINKLLIEDNRIRNIYVLLDEPDVFIHPEWSRKFISFIVSSLNKYKNVRFNLIMTTNSPYMLSDVLPSNIIKIVNNGDILNTESSTYGFGSNILDILGDSFFLKDLFGEIATKEIEKTLIEIENIRDTDSPKIEEIKKFICIIGDTIVSNMMKRKLDLKIEKLKIISTNNDKNKLIVDALNEKLSNYRKLINEKEHKVMKETNLNNIDFLMEENKRNEYLDKEFINLIDQWYKGLREEGYLDD